MTKTLPSTMALAAAALFIGGSLGGCAHKQKLEAGQIKCFGVNECSGQAHCDVPDGRVAEGSKGHICGGLNECKGKGWLALTQAECDEKGGERGDW
jgi:uncharacterized membrane protein